MADIALKRPLVSDPARAPGQGWKAKTILGVMLLLAATLLFLSGCAPAGDVALAPQMAEEPLVYPTAAAVEAWPTATPDPTATPEQATSSAQLPLPSPTLPLSGVIKPLLPMGVTVEKPTPEGKPLATATASRPMPDLPQGAGPDGEFLADLPAQIGPDDRTEIRVQFTVDATETQSVIIEVGNPAVAPEDLTPSLQAERRTITLTLPAAPQMGVSLGLSPGILRVDGPPIDEIVWRPLVETSADPSTAARWRQTPQVWEWIVQGEPATVNVPAGVSEVRVRVFVRATDDEAIGDLATGFDFPVKLVRPVVVAAPLLMPTVPATSAPGDDLITIPPSYKKEGGPNLVIWGLGIGLLLLLGGLAVLEFRRRQSIPPQITKPDPAPVSVPVLSNPVVPPTVSPFKGYTSLNFSVLRTDSGYKILAKSELDDREAAHNFTLDLAPDYLLALHNAVQLAGLRAVQPSRRVGNREELVIQEFGTRLFDGVVNEDVRDLYMSTVEKARGKEIGVVLRFNFEEVPELSALPWEYLYDTRSRRFLALDSTRPLVRYRRSTASLSVEALAVKPPLRVLVVESRPKGVAELDTITERRSILAALQSDPNLVGKIELEILEDATLSALQGKLRSNSYHVFHFIGHGTYSQDDDTGYLLFEGKNEQPELVPGHILGSLLGDHFPMRLVFLNACEGAAVSATDGDPFRGVATSLVQRNLPAVIAMQTEITDRAAVQLAADFYAALAANYPVDAALAEARKALDYHFPGSLEWGKPVLYLCQQTGQLFDLSE